MWAECLGGFSSRNKLILWTDAKQGMMLQGDFNCRMTHLLCDKYFPVTWPEPSHPGIGHLNKKNDSLGKKVCTDLVE